MSRKGSVGVVVLLVAAWLAVAAGCAGLTPAPQGVPAGREGWLRYQVGKLRFEAPETWAVSGSERKARLEREGGMARLEVSTPEAAFASEAACMEDAAVQMKRGEALQHARNHPTTFAGVRALSLEGDLNGWHVWAWAACDGGVQYQVFLTARTPAPVEVIEAYRALVGSARVGGDV